MVNILKYLNAYAGIGGNRKSIPGEIKINGAIYKIKVIAVENNKEIAKLYKEMYPQDEVIIGDAHKYILENYDKFDFIWSSVPCQSHSRARYWGSFGKGRTKIYPDMGLYQEILFLKHYCREDIKWVVENVKPYYEPLDFGIKPKEVGRHLFWSNFNISNIDSKTMFFPKDSLPKLQELYGVDLSNLKVKIDKRVILRNMVNPKLGKHIFDCAFRTKQKLLSEVSLVSSHE